MGMMGYEVEGTRSSFRDVWYQISVSENRGAFVLRGDRGGVGYYYMRNHQSDNNKSWMELGFSLIMFSLEINT